MPIETTEQLDLPYPDEDENANPPEDFQALAERLEAIISDGHSDLWSVGDFKQSAKNVDHGRWLVCDGRSLTQAEIEAALGLPAGKAAPFVAIVGTGSGGMYGDTVEGEIKLPDARGRAPMGAGAAPGLTNRLRGAVPGTETVQLTKLESGLPSHGHGVTDPGHVHTDTLDVQPNGDHQHTDGTLATGLGGASHVHTPAVAGYRGITFGALPSGGSNRLLTESGSGGTVPDSGGSGFGDLHAHDVQGATGTTGSHDHTLTGSVQEADTGLTVNNNGGANAAEAHNNVQPSIVLGHFFIRV